MSLIGIVIVTLFGENVDEKVKWIYLLGGKLIFCQFVGDGSSTIVSLFGLKCGLDLVDCFSLSFFEMAFTVVPFFRQVRIWIVSMRDKIINRDVGG